MTTNMLVTACSAFVLCAASLSAQGVAIDDVGRISGSLQMDAQTYTEDTLIGAPDVPEKMLSNTFVNVLFQRGKFTAGLRFESYQGPLLGIDPRYGTSGNGSGLGIPYRFATYTDDKFEITAGNFYEQWGTGMVLRTYEERNLGLDNSIDGVRLKVMPVEGLRFTGFTGRQRAFFDVSAGTIRGADVNADLGAMFTDLLPTGSWITLGAGFVSRYQEERDPLLRLPQNVSIWGARGSFGFDAFSLDVEYASKINDPSPVNNLSYNPGNGLFVNASFAAEGIGVNVGMKRIDNLDFRSDRSAAGFQQQVNYLPALTKQHTWRLITLYPYATQPTGELAIQADVTWTIPKGSFLGDDETIISLNFSDVHMLDTVRLQNVRNEYTANFWWSDRQYYLDFNAEVQRKWGRKFKTTLSYVHIQYDKDVIEKGLLEKTFGVITADFAVLELWWQFDRNKSLRTEFQYMSVGHETGAKLDLQNGDWVMALVELSISPSWYVTVFDEYNYGNMLQDENGEYYLRVHYPNASVAWVEDALRIQAGYGRVRGGILCVGGICRPVPASNGFTLGVTYTF